MSKLTREERLERLENTLYELIDAFQSFNADYTWQSWNDGLKDFKSDLEQERTEDVPF